MMLRAILFQILMSLPASTHTPETPEARQERMAVVASAIADASEELARKRWPGTAQEIALVLTTIAWHESGFDLDVHAGRCKDHQCDAYLKNGVVLHRAASLWQLHANKIVPPKVWATIAGVDEESTRRAAFFAGSLASGARGMCAKKHRSGDWLVMTFAAYGTGYACHTESAKLRAATFQRFSRKAEAIRAELRRAS